MRNDIHSPKNIVPEDYRYIASFHNGEGKGFVIPINMDFVMELRRDRKRDFANIHGGNCDCDICGRAYNQGEIWEHVPTKQLITLGHMCAMKYDLCANDQEYAHQKAASILAAKKKRKNEIRAENIEEILSENPGLKEALELDHTVIRDINFRFSMYGAISEKQIEVVLKIANQIANREKNRLELIDIPAPGRQTIIGKIVSTKWKQYQFGYNRATEVLQGLIIVSSPKGKWKTWGTISNKFKNLLGEYDSFEKEMLNKIVQFDAVVSVAENDPKMSFFSRPTKVKIIS